jgi:hypothetical protein
LLGHTDDDRFVETSVQIRQAQGTFPSAFGAAVYLLVEMLEDEETLDNGATGLFKIFRWIRLVYPYNRDVHRG